MGWPAFEEGLRPNTKSQHNFRAVVRGERLGLHLDGTFVREPVVVQKGRFSEFSQRPQSPSNATGNGTLAER